jgi:hypothetical protein
MDGLSRLGGAALPQLDPGRLLPPSKRVTSISWACVPTTDVWCMLRANKKSEIPKIFKSLINTKRPRAQISALCSSNPLYISRQHDANRPVNPAMVRNRGREHVTCYMAARTRARQSLARQASAAGNYWSVALFLGAIHSNLDTANGFSNLCQFRVVRHD